LREADLDVTLGKSVKETDNAKSNRKNKYSLLLLNKYIIERYFIILQYICVCVRARARAHTHTHTYIVI